MKKILIIVISFLFACGVFFMFYKINAKRIYASLEPTIKLNGDNEITVGLNETFEDTGAKAYFDEKDVSNNIKVDNNVDYTKLGEYEITYSITENNKTAKVTRKIKVIDKDAPVITLEGEKEDSFYVGTTYTESGYSAFDNTDGDLTSDVVVDNPIDINTPGTYEIKYTVSDSSGNITEEVRTITYVPFKTLPSENATATGIAVLNYHFFYAEGESQGGGNFMRTDFFEEQLKYLKDNNYKTLTMEEFRAWMYGEIELPARSVLLTIDDGAMGTGIHNGNKLIPLLEKYEQHATLFLVTGWWDIENYRSSYLDIESHTNDMHTSSYCDGVARGAQMLCYSDEQVLADLRSSISITGSNTALCYPFYAYTEHSIELTKEAGFKLGFASGGYKATRNSNKYAIPRYHMYDFTPLGEFVNMIA